jgi:hypothetical protein
VTQVGIDVGGTWLRAALARNGRIVKRSRRRVQPDTAKQILELLKFWNLFPDRLIVGARGAWHSAPRRKLQRTLRATAKKVTVLSDLELAHLAALGGPGVVVIAGTGSSAMALSPNGLRRKAGGKAPRTGDPGSAAAIAWSWRPGADPKYAPQALRSRRGPVLAQKAGRALGNLAKQAARGLAAPIALSWQGGVLRDARLRRAFITAAGNRFVAKPPKLSPASAASLLE